MFFRNYKIIIFLVILLVFVLSILSYNLKRETGYGFLRNVVLEAAAPVQNVLTAAEKSVTNAWSRYLLLVGMEEENTNLKKKINELKAELTLYQEGYLEAKRLRSLLSLQDDFDYEFIAARVIGREQTALARTISINKGSSEGVNVGMPVMARPGLIGRVINSSWHTAKVLLLIDESSNIDALVERTRTQGIVRGAGSRGCSVKYISKTQDVKEGDAVVSSGIGGMFPKGLLIGYVNHVDRQDAGLFLKIDVAPVIDFSKLEEVLVLGMTEGEGED
jgi:rod shape-determining protein MreC